MKTAKTFLYYILFCTFFLLLFKFIIAQNQTKIDSLENILKNTQDDTLKLKILNKLALTIKNSNPEKALQYAVQQLELSEAYCRKNTHPSNRENIVKAYNNLGVINKSLGNYDKAMEFYMKGLKISEDIKNRKGASISYINIGEINRIQGNYEKAIEFYLMSLKISKDIGDSNGIASIYNNIAIIHDNRGNYVKAMEFYLMSLKIREYIGDKWGMAAAYHNIAIIHDIQRNYSEALKINLLSLKIREASGYKIGMADSYNNIAGIYYNQGNYSKAMEYFMMCLKTSEEIGNKIGLGSSYINIGELLKTVASDTVFENINELVATGKIDTSFISIAEVQGEFLTNTNETRIKLYQRSLEYFLKAMQIGEMTGIKMLTIQTLSSIGDLYIKLNRANEALAFLEESLVMAIKIENKLEASLVHKSIYDAYTAMALQTVSVNKKVEYYELAQQHILQHIQLKDSLFSEKSNHNLNELQTKYETEKKENENALLRKDKSINELELKRQRIVNYSYIAGLFFAILLMLLLYNRYRIKQKSNRQLKNAYDKLKTLEEYKEMMTGMIVHDLKNPLNSIIGLTNPKQSEQHRLVYKAGKQMLNLVMNILDVQKFEDTKVKLSLDDFSILSVANDGIKQVHLLAAQKDLLIENKLKSIWFGKFDFELISRVFVNLLTNAVKFTHTGGKIIIDADLFDEQYIKVSITDTGSGIPPDKLDKIFDKFSQIDARKSGEVRSTGIGLTFCKLVIEAHKGKIWAESELGKGTTFYFTILLGKEAKNIEKITDEIEVINEELVLTKEEKLILLPFLKDFKKLDVYDVSQNCEILKRINDNGNNVIKKWKEELESAVFDCNISKFDKLLKLIE